MLKIHECAARGDLQGVSQALATGVSIDRYNTDGLTPLMVAAASSHATAETLHGLIELGANVNALQLPIVDADATPAQRRRAESVESVLGYAVKQCASLEKIVALLQAGADAGYVNGSGYSVLVHAIYQAMVLSPEDGQLLVARLIAAGAPLEAVSRHGESAVTVAGRNGQFEILKLLLEAGADPQSLHWNALFFAVACGSVEEVRRFVVDRDLLEQRDAWDRTPLLVAVRTGSVEKAATLLQAGADLSATGHCDRTALMAGLESQSREMVKWLIEQGVDLDELNEMGDSPLRHACQSGATEIVRELIAAGADTTHRDTLGRSLMHAAANPEIVELLSESIASLDDIDHEMRKALVKHEGETLEGTSLNQFGKYRNRNFGRLNPERMNNPFWERMVRARVSAYHAAVELGETTISREPIWCFTRYGHSFTKLPDGRYIEIGGEHEDFYDPDFCIYNDVVVHHGDGTFDIFGYPEEVFPPTDFHSATLVGRNIYIIGSLGYGHQHQPNHTPVYKLDTATFKIEIVTCTGECPGWIHKHSAKLCSEHEVEITGGLVLQNDDLLPNGSTYRLDLNTRVWQCMAKRDS